MNIYAHQLCIYICTHLCIWMQVYTYTCMFKCAFQALVLILLSIHCFSEAFQMVPQTLRCHRTGFSSLACGEMTALYLASMPAKIGICVYKWLGTNSKNISDTWNVNLLKSLSFIGSQLLSDLHIDYFCSKTAKSSRCQQRPPGLQSFKYFLTDPLQKCLLPLILENIKIIVVWNPPESNSTSRYLKSFCPLPFL